MLKRIEKTKPGWYIPIDVKDKFVNFCSDVGEIIQNDMAGALWLWCYMPPDIRELAKLAAFGKLNLPEKAWREFGRSVQAGVLSQQESPDETSKKK